MIPREAARILSKGKSFEYSKWAKYVQYTNDCFKQDFVSYNNSLLVCTKSHLSDEHNQPELLYENPNNPYIVTGIKNSEYWELVMTGYTGVVYIPTYDDETGILSWRVSLATEEAAPVRIKLLGPWENSSGEDSASLGLNNHTSGDYAISAGLENNADGNYSQAFGYNTKTNNEAEVSFGKFNDSTEDTLFSVGNGTSDDSRSNAFEITKDGVKFFGIDTSFGWIEYD